MNRARALLPPILLAAYGLGSIWGVMRHGAPVLDDHPGQLYRLYHVLTVGLPPWRWNPGWWAGYPELQFYPPGFAYLGAAIHYATLGWNEAPATYGILLWVVYVLPGVSTYALLARVLRDPWLALPGAFLALTLSAGSRSGVEEGVRWGLVAARLGWGLLPLLALSLVRWIEGAPRLPVNAALLLAAVLLTHPAHVPAGASMVILGAWVGAVAPAFRLGQGVSVLLLAGGLGAFWLVPLLAHLELALPLAWGDASWSALAAQIGERPLLVLLAMANLTGWLLLARAEPRSPALIWLLAPTPAMLALVVLDAVLAPRLGLHWIPADRLMDSFLLALILGASAALSLLARIRPGIPSWALALAVIATSVGLAGGSREPTLSLGIRPGQWPTYRATASGLRLEELWATLREEPAGRVLFVRSAVPLGHGRDWWRPHSHLSALAPIAASREILNGTFTHPSPVAGLLYTGSAASQPITQLVEQRDGKTLFGRPLERLMPAEFDRLAEPLRISIVVALDEDDGRLGFVSENPGFGLPKTIGPFRVFASRGARPTPASVGPGRWRLEAGSHAGGWVSAGVAYSPLWEARVAEAPIPSRRDKLGLLEVAAPAMTPLVVELTYRPGRAEWGGVALSLACSLGILATCLRKGTRE